MKEVKEWLKIVIWFSLFFVMIGCLKSAKSSFVLNPESDKSDEVFDLVAKDFNSKSFATTQNKWMFFASKASMDQKNKRTYLEKVILDYYNEKQEVISSLKAKLGAVHLDSNDLYFSNDVVIRNNKGTIIKGDFFKWNNSREIITSKELVTIEKKKWNNVTRLRI